MEIPDALVGHVRKAWAVIVLGAGASVGAVNSRGENPPSSRELAKTLAGRFLGGRYAEEQLQVVAELAISESDLFTVQDFIYEVLAEFRPAEFHRLMTTFAWHAAATTNYDLVTEQVYASEGAVQNLVPFISDKDRVEDSLKDARSLAYLKIHGCISRTHDADTPLILTPDQYITHRRGRERLFRRLNDWGHEHPLVFVGHRLQDSDIRQLLLELSALGDARPRYYLVLPGAGAASERFWDHRKVTVLDGTYEEFLRALDAEIPREFRGITIDEPEDHPIAKRFVVAGGTLTEPTRDFLTYAADFVHSGIPVEALEPRSFYRGLNPGWAAVERSLDVRRRVGDTILTSVVLQEEVDKDPVELHVLRAEAGAGKTTCLKRIAWDAAVEFEKLCIVLKPEGRLAYDPLADIGNLTKERIYLFVDDAGDHVPALVDVIRRAKAEGLPLTIITAERVNEWNVTCEKLEPEVTATHRLPYLSETEIERLVALLGAHRSLGSLETATHADRVNAFVQRAGRQLLVALHEATQGRPFEEILIDEYEQVQPDDAKRLYLSVCVLNRLNVPVRAGLISRVHGIPFAEFQDKLFKPLEHVVQVRYDPLLRDQLYSARHPLIAHIVFDRILTVPEERYDEYTRLISALDISYNTDRQAFHGLMRARNLLELFPDHDAVVELFNIAMNVAGDDPFIHHQRGIYEMRRPNGSLSRAYEYLARARELAPRDSSVVHSLAELELFRAEAAQGSLEREHHRREARALAALVKDDPAHGAYGYHTLVKLALSRLSELLNGEEPPARDIDAAIQDIESQLERAMQQFPGDEYLLAAEAQFGVMLRDADRAIRALRAAFKANRRSPFIARALANALVDRNDVPEAIEVLEAALDANRSDRRLHFALATALRHSGSRDYEKILYHLKRSFAPGDNNYLAQFWYAVYLFVTGTEESLKESKAQFRATASARVRHDLRRQVRTRYSEIAEPRTFTGRILRLDGSNGHIERDGPADWIFIHESQFAEDDWSKLRRLDLVRFEVAFSFFGPIAINVERVGK